MPNDPTCNLCIHGHFYQPPRTDPFTGQIQDEPAAAPYPNWNERINAECYRPIADAGHFARLSFNLGPTLAQWLASADSATLRRIVQEERGQWRSVGVGNGLAQPMHHTILPLARHLDKVCQVRWGIASFRHYFGHDPAGMWLPEMAVDGETLEVLAAEGIQFTILSDEQVRGDLDAGSGPYEVTLSGQKGIEVFVRDRQLSNSLSFGMPEPSQIEEWIRSELAPRCRPDTLVLIATDGETFGHHHSHGVDVLNALLEPAAGAPYKLTTLGVLLDRHPSRSNLAVIDKTAWSCGHHLDRWAVGCECTPGDSRWKGHLRKALDRLADELDPIFETELQRIGSDPYLLRDAYIEVVLGETGGAAFLSSHGLNHLTRAESGRVLDLLRAHYYRQQMYVSCAFFFEDLDRDEPRYAIDSAARAIALTRRATQEDLADTFRKDLKSAVSGKTGRTGADMFDALLALDKA